MLMSLSETANKSTPQYPTDNCDNSLIASFYLTHSLLKNIFYRKYVYLPMTVYKMYTPEMVTSAGYKIHLNMK